MSRPTVLVIGDYRQTLTVVRSLAARGMRAVVGRTRGKRSQIRYSRYAAEVWAHPPIDEGFTPAFLDAVDRFRPVVVFPVGDREISWFGNHREHLPAIPIAAPDATIAAECLDKATLMKRTADLGIDHAPFHVVSDPRELEAAVAALGFPCFVKPHDPLLRLFETRGIRFDDPDDLRRRFISWPEGHRRLIVQRYFKGPRHNVYFAAHTGRLIGAVEVEILRTDCHDGTGLAVDGLVVEASPALLAGTASLVKDLKYTGVGCTQFLVGRDGSTSFLELNPRLGANYVVVHSAGLDLASIAVDLATDREVVTPRLRTGIRYAWTLGDIEGLKRAVVKREVSRGEVLRRLLDVGRAAWRADVHVTWRFSDPLPSIVLAHRTLTAPLVRRLDPRRLLRARRGTQI